MAWPKGKPRRPVPPSADGAAQIGALGVPVPEGAKELAPSGPPHAPQPPPMANSGSGDVLMQGPSGAVTEVHPGSVAVMEVIGWRRYGD